MKIIVILGPTASGKTDLSIKTALYLEKAEIISADSRQVYKGMNLGTGKITKEEMKGIPHHLLDVASPKRKFTVVQYQERARKAIKKIIKRDNVPIIVGGTGFYIDAVIKGMIFPSVPPDYRLRKEIEKENLFELLKKLDPKRADTIDKKNPRRLIRAIEIILKTKKPVPEIKEKPLPYPIIKIGIKNDNLPPLIKKRLLKRIEQGMIEEVKRLRKTGLSWKRLEELGLEYRYLALYLQEKIDYEEMIKSLAKEIEKFAKRQMTWFKRDKEIIWVKNWQEAKKIIKLNFF